MPKRRARSDAASAARVLHLDAFSGAAGNMFLGAMLDVGLSRADLLEGLAPLDLDFRLVVKRVSRGALAARHVDVRVPHEPGGRRTRSAGGAHGAGHAHAPGHGRSYASIRRLLEGAALADGVRRRALAIFEALGRAEAKVHGTTLDRVHFHEVGAVDAIVDVTGAAVALEVLGIERVSCSPVALGHGTVDTEHGRLPLPAPATIELMRGVPTVPAHVEWETLTPTGAAILRSVVDEFGVLPAMTIERIGHGAGGERTGPMPNVLRAVLGRASSAGRDRVVCLETNLDDLVPEHFDYVMERLFEAGALDVAIQHLQMKKNRPGFMLRVLCRPADREALARIVFAESTAIGVRASEWDRLVLARRSLRLRTPEGAIRVKVVEDLDGGRAYSPEYDDCKKVARKSGRSLREVIVRAERQAREEDSA